MKKIKLDYVLVCEGKYDKIKLSGIFETEIFCTNGFGIYKNKQLLALLKELSNKKKIAIITDSDSAGFMIRNHLKKCIGGNIYNVFIPDIYGKEKRKSAPSKENKLGVEGIEKKIIIEAFEKAGLIGSVKKNTVSDSKKITKQDFFEDGFSGRDNSREKRKKLKAILNLPENLSCNGLLDTINIILTYDNYKTIAKTIDEIAK